MSQRVWIWLVVEAKTGIWLETSIDDPGGGGGDDVFGVFEQADRSIRLRVAVIRCRGLGI